MSDDDARIPDPGANEEMPESSGSPFDNLSPEIIDLVFPGEAKDAPVGDFSAPNYKATKPKWWQRKAKGETRSTPKPKKPMPSIAPSALRNGLIDFYTGAAFMLMPFQPEIAMRVAESAEKCADAWIEFSKTNPAVKRFLIGLITASAGGALLMAHMPIMIAIAIQVVPGMKEKQENAMSDFVSRMSSGIPTTEDEGK